MSHITEIAARIADANARRVHAQVSHRLRPRRSRTSFRPIADPLVARWLAP